MKKEKYGDIPQEKIVEWLEELKAQDERLDQENMKLNEQYSEFQRQEQEYNARRQNAARESEEERQLRELREKIEGEKGKARHARLAFWLILVFMVLCAASFFGYNAVIKARAYENEQKYHDYQEKLRALTDERRSREEEYQKAVSALELDYQKRMQELETEYNVLMKDKEQEFLARKESIETNIREQVFKELNTDTEDEAREQLDNLPTRSTKFLETVYKDGIPYYICREKYNLSYYGNANAGTNVIYPGAIIRGDTIFSSDYTVVPIKCGSAELVCDIQGSPAITVSEVNYGNVQRELDTYRELASNRRYRNTDFRSVIVHSEEQVNASLGISGKVSATSSVSNISGSGSVSTSLGSSYQQDKTNLLVTVNQIAYTVSVQPRQDSLDFFAEGADLRKLGDYAPAYISSVDYGRSIVIMISSDNTEEELKMAVDAGVQLAVAGGADISGELKAAYDKLKKNSTATCSIIVVGGNAEATSFPSMTVSNCMEKLSEFLKEGEENGILNPVPISYKMNYVCDNSAVPCVQVVREKSFPKDDVEILQLQWMEGKKLKGTFSYEINGVGLDTFVVGSNILGVQEGNSTDNVVYMIVKKDVDCSITINKKEEKKKLFGGNKINSNAESLKINDQSKLDEYSIYAVQCGELPDVE